MTRIPTSISVLHLHLILNSGDWGGSHWHTRVFKYKAQPLLFCTYRFALQYYDYGARVGGNIITCTKHWQLKSLLLSVFLSYLIFLGRGLGSRFFHNCHKTLAYKGLFFNRVKYILLCIKGEYHSQVQSSYNFTYSFFKTWVWVFWHTLNSLQ